MALITCPECSRDVSDIAIACPQCGYPISAFMTTKRKPRGRGAKNKRKKLPNGFGSITEIKGKNLRKPFYARKTVGRDEFGKPILKPLKPESYFDTYEAAFAALVEYNRNPYDLAPDITLQELYDKWTRSYFETLKSESSARTITSSWAYCSALYNMRAKDVRARHIKGCMDEGYVIIERGKHKGEIKRPTAGIKSRIKSMFNLMLDYAVEYEIIDRNYARTFEISDDIIKEKEAAKRNHFPFHVDELQKLWDNQDIPYVGMILIQCYSGWRPQEMGLIELSNVDILNWVFTGGMKTDAGINRLVPIHTKIRPIVLKYYDEAIALVGHAITDVTEKVYTERDLEWLRSEIEKIK